MLLVACYFARCARRDAGVRSRPPEALGARTWKAAYDSFFEALGDGRTLQQFRHSLYDARFNFGVLLDRGRLRRHQGTRRKPTLFERIHEEWADRGDAELEQLVLGFRAGRSPSRRR